MTECPHAVIQWIPFPQSADRKVAPGYWPRERRCVAKGPHTTHVTTSGKEWS